MPKTPQCTRKFSIPESKGNSHDATPPTNGHTAFRSLIGAELAKITALIEAADRRAQQGTTILNREAAEAERRKAEEGFWAASEVLTDLSCCFCDSR